MLIINRFVRIISHLLHQFSDSRKIGRIEKTSQNLGRYLSPRVVKNIEKLGATELGGTVKKVVTLFSDIRSFTSITEGIDASTLVTLLNYHFEVMGAVIEKYEGTLDKLVGDLIMVVWNIPIDQPDPELKALKAALEMQRQMINKVVPKWAEHGVKDVGCGIGINSGKAVVGNLGSSYFMNYTVAGDSINTAQRLEAKAAKGEVWVSDAVWNQVKNKKVERPVRVEKIIKLKGKEQVVNAHVFIPLEYRIRNAA